MVLVDRGGRELPIQADYAVRTVEIEAARKAWSKGFVVEAIDKFCRTQEVMDVSGSPHRGVLSADDMARWQATVEAPFLHHPPTAEPRLPGATSVPPQTASTPTASRSTRRSSPRSRSRH